MESNRKNLILKYQGKDEYAIKYQTVQEFLDSDYIKQIPPYQRPYSWGQSHVKRLWMDILESLKEKKEWFLGPVFTSYRYEKSDIRELLDGQQRMTTITLILRCLYTAEYLITDTQWDNPSFSIDPDCEDIEAEKIKLKQEYLTKHKNVKNTIRDLLLHKKSQGLGSTPKYVSKFHTAESTKKSLNEFLEGITKIETRTDFENSMRGVRAEEGDEFAPTLFAINVNISWIEESIKKILVQNDQVVKDGFKKLFEFIEALLSLTFIEIPLNKDEDVVDIFESINNRGKKLTLSDIIRFRTIKAYAGNPKQQEIIGKKWSEIFRYSNKLSSGKHKYKKYFTSLDNYLERHINALAISNSGYTDNNERIERFCDYYSSKDRTLSDGVDEVLLTLKKWNFIVNGDFENLDIWRRYRNNVSGLIHLLKSSLVYSDNSQICFISYLINSVNKEYANESFITAIPHQLLQIVKTTFSISVFHKYASNEARNRYIWIARSYNPELMPAKREGTKYPDGPYTYNQFSLEYSKGGEKVKVIDVRDLTLSDTNLNNILWVKGSEKDTAELILGLYQMICGGTIPTSNSFEEDQLDHVMPQKWFKNRGWKSITSIEVLKASVSNIQDSDVKNTFELLLKREDFYSETKWAPTFIQLIGNKVHLHADANRSKSNSFWHRHEDNKSSSKEGAKKFLEQYFKERPNDAFIVPSFPENIYDIEDFSITSIVNRSVSIAETIVTKFKDFSLTVQ